MTAIKKLIDGSGNQYFPQTHTKAVVDDDGYSVESRMQAVQDVVNQAQMEIGAVPSDLTPTENSSNWVTSGGVYNATTVDKFVEISLSDYTAVRAFPSSSTPNWTCTNDNYPYYGYFIPITAGERYKIKGNDTAKTVYAFLLNNTYSHGNPVPYATNSSRVAMGVGETVVDTAPLDANYLYVSQQWDSDRTPQEIEELGTKNVKDVLTDVDTFPTIYSGKLITSGGVYNAMEVVRGEIDERTVIQKEITLTLKDGWATATTWTKNDYYNKHAVIPVDSIKGCISIKANATNGGRYGFLSSYPSTITNNSTVAWCSGTGRNNITAGGTVTIMKTDFPEDCQYVYIGVANTTASTTNNNYLPQAVNSIFDLKDAILEIEHSINKESEPIAIDINSYGSVHVWRTDNSWVNTYTGKFIPVTPKASYAITAHAENASYCCMTQDNTNNPSLATGSSRVTISANQTRTLTAPDDAMFLWISDTASVVRLPQSIEESEVLSIDTIGKILPLVKEMPNLLPLPKEMPNTINANNYQAINIGPAADGVWRAPSGWYGKFVPVNGHTHIYMQAGNAEIVYCLLTNGSYASGQNVSYAEGYSGNGRRIQANTSVTVEIPSGASSLYYFATFNNYTTSNEPEKIILLNEIVCRDELDDSSSNKFPTYIEFGENEGVMYTIDNFIMKHIYENEVEYLCFSTDLGKNWIQVENTFDTKITHAHYFIDGTLLICTPTKCYWTKDFQTFTESVVYDYDGSLFQPESGTRFYNIPKYKEKRTFVDNEEWHLWGDYIITTTRPRLWYTKDNGRTIRAAFAFGLSSIDGTVYPARHIHAFEYNPYDEHFYAFTGDSDTECHIIKGQYNNGTWTWEHIVTGALWKLTSPVFFNGYFAAVTDYTDSSLSEKKGLVRCPTNAISEENICYLFKATSSMMGNAALSGYIYDKNGWRVMTCDYLGGNKVLMAKNNYNFTWVYNVTGKRMNSFIGPNANGDVYVFYGSTGGSSSINGEDWLRINRNTFNFTKAMRDAGASNFFDYRITEF